MDATLKKQKGIHYTPPELARFLARQTTACIRPLKNNRITILDPACGDGQLLASMIEALRLSISRPSLCPEINVVGYETDPEAVDRTERRLQPLGLASVQINNEDFLASEFGNSQFDCVIANPPYVRTQVLGGLAAQRLAQKFDLNGRVDLYHAFAVAIGSLLRPGGSLGLLTSNRFLTVRSGRAMRRLLRTHFDLKHVFDLGDTRLFEAAVLPVVVSGVKLETGQPMSSIPEFCRVYRSASNENAEAKRELTILDAIDNPAISGEVETSEGRFLIERGELVAKNEDSVWTLGNSTTRKWLEQIHASQCQRFGDLAEIKVGIKTTADAVFIRENWDSLSPQPESSLLLPLITHHDAERWTICTPRKKVLYPYDLSQSSRSPVQLAEFPRTSKYLESHRPRLEGRRYVVDSGRYWFEIWVPHQPAQWAKPKLVWPDISEEPKFFLDSSGAIVNGDCYWIKLRDGVDPDWLYLMLAVANSSLATKFYDTVFHNKLYAGRRRYMTQYVKEFPLPELDSELGSEIVSRVKRLIQKPAKKNEAQVEKLVSQAFGFGGEM